jgi:sulfur carrier protein
VKVLLRNPRRELEVDGPMTIINLLDRLGLNREEVLVIRGDELVPGDETLADDTTPTSVPSTSSSNATGRCARRSTSSR